MAWARSKNVRVQNPRENTKLEPPRKQKTSKLERGSGKGNFKKGDGSTVFSCISVSTIFRFSKLQIEFPFQRLRKTMINYNVEMQFLILFQLSLACRRVAFWALSYFQYLHPRLALR